MPEIFTTFSDLFVARKRRKRFPTTGSQHAMGQHMLVTGAQRLLPTSQHFIVKVSLSCLTGFNL